MPPKSEKTYWLYAIKKGRASILESFENNKARKPRLVFLNDGGYSCYTCKKQKRYFPRIDIGSLSGGFSLGSVNVSEVKKSLLDGLRNSLEELAAYENNLLKKAVSSVYYNCTTQLIVEAKIRKPEDLVSLKANICLYLSVWYYTYYFNSDAEATDNMLEKLSKHCLNVFNDVKKSLGISISENMDSVSKYLVAYTMSQCKEKEDAINVLLFGFGKESPSAIWGKISDKNCFNAIKEKLTDSTEYYSLMSDLAGIADEFSGKQLDMLGWMRGVLGACKSICDDRKYTLKFVLNKPTGGLERDVVYVWRNADKWFVCSKDKSDPQEIKNEASERVLNVLIDGNEGKICVIKSINIERVKRRSLNSDGSYSSCVGSGTVSWLVVDKIKLTEKMQLGKVGSIEDFVERIDNMFFGEKYVDIKGLLTKSNLDGCKMFADEKRVKRVDYLIQCLNGEMTIISNKKDLYKLIFVVAVFNNLPFLVEAVINHVKSKKALTNLFKDGSKESRFIFVAWDKFKHHFGVDNLSALSYAVEKKSDNSLIVNLINHASSDLLKSFDVQPDGSIPDMNLPSELKGVVAQRVAVLVVQQAFNGGNGGKDGMVVTPTPRSSKQEVIAPVDDNREGGDGDKEGVTFE